MFFKSEKKVLKNTILEVVNEKTPEYINEVKEIKNNTELTTDAREIEIEVTKKRHLDDVFSTVIEKLSAEYPEKVDSMHYMVMDPGYCGYELDADNGFLAGGIYAICHFALMNKVAPATDCAELNSRHAFMMAQAMI